MLHDSQKLDDRQKLFLEGPISRALIRLAIPIILGNLLQTGYQLTDAFWVGRLGAAAVAAVSISFPITFLVIALGAGLGIAGATLSAQYMGAGRQDLVNHVAAQTMMMVTRPRFWARLAMRWRRPCSNCWPSHLMFMLARSVSCGCPLSASSSSSSTPCFRR